MSIRVKSAGLSLAGNFRSNPISGHAARNANGREGHSRTHISIAKRPRLRLA
jgi:hypothetical protein